MSTFIQTIREKAKAVAAACGAIVQSAVLTVIVDPQTEAAIVKIIPVPYQVLASLILGGIITAVVHRVPNATPVEPVAYQEPSTATQLQAVITAGGGEFTGTAAH